jgi:serine/threonine-protein kinase
MGQPALIVMGLVAVALAGGIGFLLSDSDRSDAAEQARPSTTIQPPQAATAEPEPSTVTKTATQTVAKPRETVIVAPPPVRPAPAPSRGAGDLGLSVPISYPPCDGLGIAIVYSATNPDKYRLAVQQALNSNPGSSYLRTDLSCPSLRQSSDDGTAIYAVFYPAGYSKSSVCSMVRQFGPGAYGRWLGTDISPTHKIVC